LSLNHLVAHPDGISRMLATVYTKWVTTKSFP